MKRVVITGSTRGIGFGLADAFLELGCAVTVSGQTRDSVNTARQQLSLKHGIKRIHGCPCDVIHYDQVEMLWRSAQEQFSGVDIWINNAGIGHPFVPTWELQPGEAEAVVKVNVIGTLHGSRVALRHMAEQGHGQLYLMLGHGARGDVRDGMSVYGMTKAAVHYLSKALISETRDLPIQIGTLSPGMVVTDLLLDRIKVDPEILTRARPVFNLLTDRVETVTPWLARKILANSKNDAHIRWMTPFRLIGRFLSAPLARRDPFGDLLG